MAWPHLVTTNTTCPECKGSADSEVIHWPFERVYGSRHRIYQSSTWATCPACGNEWKLDARVAYGPLPAA